jgi:hypothetical protein
MPRFILALALACAALQAMAAAPGAKAAGNALSICLDASTTILAGGDVSDKDLAAAQKACAELKQTTQDPKLLTRINAASGNLADEAKRRHKP